MDFPDPNPAPGSSFNTIMLSHFWSPTNFSDFLQTFCQKYGVFRLRRLTQGSKQSLGDA
jgi:hypothetical protein